jgi:hypothetical protein
MRVHGGDEVVAECVCEGSGGVADGGGWRVVVLKNWVAFGRLRMCVVRLHSATVTLFSTGTPLSCVTLYTLSRYDSGPSTTPPQAECILLRCLQPRPLFTGHPPQLQQRVASHTRGWGSPGSLAGGARGAARAAASSAADELRGLYARLTERYCTKLDDNHCKQLFEYLKARSSRNQ